MCSSTYAVHCVVRTEVHLSNAWSVVGCSAGVSKEPQTTLISMRQDYDD